MCSNSLAISSIFDKEVTLSDKIKSPPPKEIRARAEFAVPPKIVLNLYNE